MSGELRTCRRAGAGSVVGLALIMNVAGAAAADVVSDEVLASRVDELNRSAVHQMQAKRFDAGRKHLFEAARLARERGGVQGDALLARTHFHLGALEIMAGVDATRAKDYSGGRCAVTPACDCPAARGATRCRQRALSGEDRVPRAPPVSAGARRARPEVPARINALDCPFPEEIFGRTDFTVRCAANPRRRVDGAKLYYDSGGTYTYKAIEMRRTRADGGRPPSRKEDVTGPSSRSMSKAARAARSWSPAETKAADMSRWSCRPSSAPATDRATTTGRIMRR